MLEKTDNRCETFAERNTFREESGLAQRAAARHVVPYPAAVSARDDEPLHRS